MHRQDSAPDSLLRVLGARRDELPSPLAREPDCEDLALFLAERQRIELRPVAIYRLGTGYLVFQPHGRADYEVFTVSSNHEVVLRVAVEE